MDLLRFAHVIEQADQILHRQEAQLFRQVALKRPQLAAQENPLQRSHRVGRAFACGGQQVLGETMLVMGGVLEGMFAGHQRIVPSLALHRLAAAHFDPHRFRDAVFRQPRLHIILGFPVQKGSRRLADLLAQVGAGDKHLGDDFGKTLLRRLGGVAALRRVIPDLIEIGADILDGLDRFKQGDQPDRRQIRRWMLPVRLLQLGAHLPVERDQRLRPGGQADLHRQRHARIAVLARDGVDLVHIVDGRIDGERVPRGDHRLLDARRDDDPLQNILIRHDFAQQALGRAVHLDGRDQGVQLLAKLLVQREVVFKRLAPLLPQLEHLLFVAVVVLPQHFRRDRGADAAAS